MSLSRGLHLYTLPLVMLAGLLARPETVQDAAVPPPVVIPPVATRPPLPRTAWPAWARLVHSRLVAAQRAVAPPPQPPYWNLRLHGVGTQLFTAWGAPITLRAVNWFGLEYAPYALGGLDRVPLDYLLGTIHSAGFNALRIMFANQTVESDPVVRQGLAANPGLQGKHALTILGIVLKRAHAFGLRVILCNSRSEAGMGPELRTGLWYTPRYPDAVWQRDWIALVTRFKHYSAFVGADLRNEPHLTGRVFDTRSYYANGPLWGAFHETYYHDRDWRYAAELMGNRLLQINPGLLIVVEGVQMYLDPDRNVLTGGLWGSNLIGVQYDPIVLTLPGQLVYSVHEYGPKMWLGDWFTPRTTYQSLADRWTYLWGYLLTAPRFMQAPLLVGEFGTCNDHYSCVASPKHKPMTGGFWFASFVHYLALHPQVSWAYWALNTNGPFHLTQRNLYALMTPDYRHVQRMLLYGLRHLLPPAARAR